MPGGICGICGAACAPEPERDDDLDFDFEDDFEDDDEDRDADCEAGCDADDEDRDADCEAGCDADGEDRDADCEAGCDAEVERCTGCAAAGAATDACTDAYADGACGARCDGACCAGGVRYGTEAGVPVWGAGSSGRCVPGRGMRWGRPGGVTTLPGSVGTRGARSSRLREIERLLSRLTDTRLCGSGKCGATGAAGSFAGSPRARVDDEDE
jgi:hypothetical protein